MSQVEVLTGRPAFSRNKLVKVRDRLRVIDDAVGEVEAEYVHFLHATTVRCVNLAKMVANRIVSWSRESGRHHPGRVKQRIYFG